MQWILDNWLLILFGGGMIAMHMFGHGHGGHGGHGGKKDTAKAAPATADNPLPSAPGAERPVGKLNDT